MNNNGKKSIKNASSEDVSFDDLSIQEQVNAAAPSSMSAASAIVLDCECGFVCSAPNEFLFNKKWDAHQLKCANNIQAVPVHQAGPNFTNWIEVPSENYETNLPPNEVDQTNQTTFLCKYGCQTDITKAQQRFLTKHTYLEHIIKKHPRVRIALESPPDATGHHEGTRTILTALTPGGK
mmetsp:Transcript_4445/g.4468  ORF Transcript_4445/g.4468 Transcript_4445/m.4468 type:complete len:179 (+) Transcript_4445:184-720(+)